MLGVVLGLWIAGAILRVNPVLNRWWTLGLQVALLCGLVWVLFRSRAWAQLIADIERHAAVFSLCLIVSVLTGMAMMTALNCVKKSAVRGDGVM